MSDAAAPWSAGGSAGGSAPWSTPWSTAASAGSGLALIDAAGAGQPAWTYDELTGRVLDLGARIRAQGLAPGQLVAAAARPGLPLVLMQHALVRLGAALLPLGAEVDDPGVRPLLAATGAEWVWEDDGTDGGRLARSGVALADQPETASDGSASWPSPLALVVETSGSTGAPRAAMLTQANLLAAAALSNARLGLVPGDTWLCCLPLRHIGGLAITYRCALAGAALLLHPGFAAAAVAADLGRRAVTHLSLVPPMLARLLDLGRPPPSSLRVVLVGGQALSAPLAQRAIDAGWPLYLTYGMTETCSHIATSGRLTAVPAAGEVGAPLPGLELDGADGAAESPALRVRGPLVMAGYANPRRQPGLGLADGWFTTSDLAVRGPDGRLRILGRADAVLVTGGVKVHPERVESALAAAPGVREIAVVGVDDPVWGQRLVACYVGAATPAALDAWCRARLAGPERPRGFLPLAALPLLESGKVDRRAVRAFAEGAATLGEGGG